MNGKLEEKDKKEWVKLNVCNFCNGYHLHSCTGYDCKDAMRKAEECFDKMNDLKMDDLGGNGMGELHRGEIYYIRRGGNQQGSEQFSERPAVIVSNEQNNKYSNVVEVVYMTTQPKTDLPTHCVIRSTGRPSTVLCEQINSVSVERIGQYIGEASEGEMHNIDIALMISLQLDGDAKTSKKYQDQIKQQQEEIDGLRKQIETEKENAEKWQEQVQYKRSEPEIERTAAGDEVIRLETERNAYRAMYENLLEKVIA